jgi:calmodulin
LNLPFIIIFQSGELTREQENELRKTFDDHDEDGSGAIDITEFERIAIDLGEPLSSEELQEIIKDLDKDGSGVVSYDEFIRWWRQT